MSTTGVVLPVLTDDVIDVFSSAIGFGGGGVFYRTRLETDDRRQMTIFLAGLKEGH